MDGIASLKAEIAGLDLNKSIVRAHSRKGKTKVEHVKQFVRRGDRKAGPDKGGEGAKKGVGGKISEGIKSAVDKVSAALGGKTSEKGPAEMPGQSVGKTKSGKKITAIPPRGENLQHFKGWEEKDFREAREVLSKKSKEALDKGDLFAHFAYERARIAHTFAILMKRAEGMGLSVPESQELAGQALEAEERMNEQKGDAAGPDVGGQGAPGTAEFVPDEEGAKGGAEKPAVAAKGGAKAGPEAGSKGAPAPAAGKQEKTMGKSILLSDLTKTLVGNAPLVLQAAEDMAKAGLVFRMKRLKKQKPMSKESKGEISKGMTQVRAHSARGKTKVYQVKQHSRRTKGAAAEAVHGNVPPSAAQQQMGRAEAVVRDSVRLFGREAGEQYPLENVRRVGAIASMGGRRDVEEKANKIADLIRSNKNVQAIGASEQLRNDLLGSPWHTESMARSPLRDEIMNRLGSAIMRLEYMIREEANFGKEAGANPPSTPPQLNVHENRLQGLIQDELQRRAGSDIERAEGAVKYAERMVQRLNDIGESEESIQEAENVLASLRWIHEKVKGGMTFKEARDAPRGGDGDRAPPPSTPPQEKVIEKPAEAAPEKAKKVKGNFGIQWEEFAGREGRVQRKEKTFTTKEARDKYASKLEEKDNFKEFWGWLDEPAPEAKALSGMDLLKGIVRAHTRKTKTKVAQVRQFVRRGGTAAGAAEHGNEPPKISEGAADAEKEKPSNPLENLQIKPEHTIKVTPFVLNLLIKRLSDFNEIAPDLEILEGSGGSGKISIVHDHDHAVIVNPEGSAYPRYRSRKIAMSLLPTLTAAGMDALASTGRKETYDNSQNIETEGALRRLLESTGRPAYPALFRPKVSPPVGKSLLKAMVRAHSARGKHGMHQVRAHYRRVEMKGGQGGGKTTAPVGDYVGLEHLKRFSRMRVEDAINVDQTVAQIIGQHLPDFNDNRVDYLDLRVGDVAGMIEDAKRDRAYYLMSAQGKGEGFEPEEEDDIEEEAIVTREIAGMTRSVETDLKKAVIGNTAIHGVAGGLKADKEQQTKKGCAGGRMRWD